MPLTHRPPWFFPVVTLTALTTLVAVGKSQIGGAAVDSTFAQWTSATPGCAVGVAERANTALTRAYGMADLEHGTANTPDTIFEAGSVAKQFTAAAVLLLAHEGKLSLDDQVRRYIPELPNYGPSLTIRHLLNHTSGLRDWGSLVAIAGSPRTTRVYTQTDVLNIIARQRALNFPPGSQWSYTNSGYNLAAIIVSRVSGMSFPDFTGARLFAPLQMRQTTWRDDFRRVVPGRAIAYAESPGGWRLDMPFESAYGNGGLLTTVGDLLRWNASLDARTAPVGPLVDELERVGTLSTGHPDGYGLGLTIGVYKGLREVGHDGSTAGYTAGLVRFPDQGVSVAVLCNVASAPAYHLAHQVADLYLGYALIVRPPAKSSYAMTAADIVSLQGTYRNLASHALLRLTGRPDGIQMESGPAFVARSSTRFVYDADNWIEVTQPGRVRLTTVAGLVDDYERVLPVNPSENEIGEYTGTFVSDEAETTFGVAVERKALVIKRQPDTTMIMTPVYRDAFTVPGLGIVVFHRDTAGRLVELSVVQDRVWDLRFRRRE
jgi:CubicO group peptidase (beta-lactamase class C family)